MFSFDPGQRVVELGIVGVINLNPTAAVVGVVIDHDLRKLRAYVGSKSLQPQVRVPIRPTAIATDGGNAATPEVIRQGGLVDQIGLDDCVVVDAGIPRLVVTWLTASS